MTNNTKQHPLSHPLPGDLLILGYGSQAKAWAQNLRDSGRTVNIVLREKSSSRKEVDQDGFRLFSSLENFEASSAFQIALLTPDDTHDTILEHLADKLPPGSRVIYAHGHSFSRHHFAEKFPQWQHVLLAPKAIASEVRRRYLEAMPLGAVYDLRTSPPLSKTEKTQATDEVLALAKDLGITFGPYLVSFEEETKADLFSEQSLLCSLIPYGAKYSYEKLIEKGVSPEVAFLECWVEIKLIVDTLAQKGPQEFFRMISPSAFVGGQKAKELFFDEEFQQKLEKLYSDIDSGRFDRELEDCSLQDLRHKVEEEWEQSSLTDAHKKWGRELFGSKN